MPWINDIRYIAEVYMYTSKVVIVDDTTYEGTTIPFGIKLWKYIWLSQFCRFIVVFIIAGIKNTN